jgi:cytochrome c-type biogenesis protein CcmF
VVFVGTVWPLIAEMGWGAKLSVGAPFFDAAVTPFFAALAAILPVGAMLAWKRGDLGRAGRGLVVWLLLAAAVAGLAFAMQTGRSALGPVAAGLGAWVIFGAIADLWARTGQRGSFVRLFRLPRADWGNAVAHIGVGVTTFACAAVTAWTVEDIRVLKPGEGYDLGAYRVTLAGVREVEGPNFLSTTADFVVTKDGQFVAELFPEKRIYPVAGMPTTEAGIDYGLTRDIYLVIGDPQEGGGYAVRGYLKPFATCIWLGVILMALGGVISLTDRRWRVAAGARRMAVVPAE